MADILKSGLLFSLSLIARQPDAVRMEWGDSQEQARPAAKRARTARDASKASSSIKSTKVTRANVPSDQEEIDPQAAVQTENAEERRQRKGKAPVRPPRPPPRPSWKSVQPSEQLVSEEEASNVQDSDYQVGSLICPSCLVVLLNPAFHILLG